MRSPIAIISSLLIIPCVHGWIKLPKTQQVRFTTRKQQNMDENVLLVGVTVTPTTLTSSTLSNLPVLDSTQITTKPLIAVFRDERLNEYANLVVATALIGVTTGFIVLAAKQGVSFLYKQYATRNPYKTLILASLFLALVSKIDINILKPTFPSLCTDNLYSNPTKLNFRRFCLRLMGLIVTIGSGFSMGIAGPAGEIGMVVAHQLASFFGIKDVKSLTQCMLAGAGAGVAANFNAPLTGAVYSWEVSRRLVPQDDKDAAVVQTHRRTNLLMLSCIFWAVMVARKGNILSEPKLLTKSTILWEQLTMPQSEVVLLIPLGLFCGLVYRWYTSFRQEVSLLLQRVHQAIDTNSKNNNSYNSKNKQDDVVVVVAETNSNSNNSSIVDNTNNNSNSSSSSNNSINSSSNSNSVISSSRNMRTRTFISRFAVHWLLGPAVAAFACAYASTHGFTQSLSLGMEVVQQLLCPSVTASHLTSLRYLLPFVAIRFVLVAVCSVVTGLIGGQYAPMFFLGAGLGALFHRVSLLLLLLLLNNNSNINNINSANTISISTSLVSLWLSRLFASLTTLHTLPIYVLSAATAMLACHFQAPIMATVFAMELTQSWNLSPALFVVSSLAVLFSK